MPPALLAVFCIGLIRGGLKGLGPLFILLMAMSFGARESSGIIVPLLLVGDVMALVAYRKHILPAIVKQFLPTVLVGLLLGVWVGKDLPEGYFQQLLVGLIVIGMLVMWVWEVRFKGLVKPASWSHWPLGIGAGFFAMIGNYGGAFASIYFLLTGASKKDMIGSATFIFFLLNVVKLPLHVYIWETISTETLSTVIPLIPAVAFGFFAGLWAVNRIGEKGYRWYLYAVNIAGAVFLLVA